MSLRFSSSCCVGAVRVGSCKDEETASINGRGSSVHSSSCCVSALGGDVCDDDKTKKISILTYLSLSAMKL